MSYSSSKLGTLFVVATPIGNLTDITYRAVDTLRNVDMIAVEDSRQSRALLKHYQIDKPLISVHDHNEEKQSEKVINKLLEGCCIALISDAGTPLVSDPGYRLVSAACKANIRIVPIPGPSAAIAALSAAGLPSNHFVFEGFLPPKLSARQTRLKVLAHEQRTLLFYEAPHRILKLLDEMMIVFGEKRYVVIAREMTKIFETFYRGQLIEVKQYLLSTHHHQKGEFVVLVQGASIQKDEIHTQAIEILHLLLKELPVSRAAALVSQITGVRKKDLYNFALADNLF